MRFLNPIDQITNNQLAAEYMSQVYVAYSFFFWLGAFAITSVLRYFVGKKTGKGSIYYRNLRLPWFISILVCSLASVWILSYAVRDKIVEATTANFFFVPYFAALVYFFVVFFRAIRDYRVEVLGGKSHTIGDKKHTEQHKSEIIVEEGQSVPKKEKQAQQRISYKKKAVKKARNEVVQKAESLKQPILKQDVSFLEDNNGGKNNDETLK